MPLNSKQNSRFERFKKLAEVARYDALTLPEAKKFVEILVEKVKKIQNEIRTETSEKSQELKRELNKAIFSLKETEKKLTDADKQSQKVSREIIPMIKQSFREIDDLKKSMPDMPDLSRHITVDNIKEHLPEIDIDSAKSEAITEAKKLDKELEEKLNKKIENLDERTAKGFSHVSRGGGTNALGVAQAFKWIAHTEEPVGNIDSVNTTYTVKNNIWWIAGFMLSGEPIAELPNFTFINKTITFSSPLPSDFSGKDFEIKYIGT